MKKFKKLLSLILLIAIISVPAATVFAYSHTYGFEFQYKLNSKIYYLYPGSENRIYIQNSASGGGGYYYFDLYKGDSYGSTYLGTSTFPSNGSGYVDLPGKGEGKYWFTLRKADDGTVVRGGGTIADYDFN
ncbi:hypothetical protein LCM10_04290 [Rossellomorea aquimaris]|uniref:hypothetical protein n=1 Tax=Rossellomorea aquimaris TaxID=189382 RepID=UPI001CD35493|nr:hypothetical protein [Rossellomorea aquimaris]MCA1054196.1 hypothetical protein [Rossellomorea aquimaris]